MVVVEIGVIQSFWKCTYQTEYFTAGNNQTVVFSHTVLITGYLFFFQDWMANINEEDEALKKLGGTKGMENDNLPPVRTAARSEKPPAEVCLNIVWNSLHMIMNDFYNTLQDMNILVRISYTWL